MAARGLIGSLLKDLNVSRGKCCLDYRPREQKRDREEGGGGGGEAGRGGGGRKWKGNSKTVV